MLVSGPGPVHDPGVAGSHRAGGEKYKYNVFLNLIKTAGRIMNCALESPTVYDSVYTAHGICLR